jgi:hypothetical protein
MKHYPICAFKEFYIDAVTAKAELKNWSNWKLWNTVSTAETNEEGNLSVLHFEIRQSPNITKIEFIPSQESGVDEFVLQSLVLVEQKLSIQWIITIKEKYREQLLISTILLEGDYAALYYEQYGIYLTKLLKIINRDFIQYLNRKYLNTKWFEEGSSLDGSYLG